MKYSKKIEQSLHLIFFFVFAISACQKTDSKINETRTETPQVTLTLYERQKSDFGFLEKGMSYQEIVDHVGKEDRDIGSGSYILEYNLADGSRVYLQFDSLKSLYRAYIIYTDGRAEDIVAP